MFGILNLNKPVGLTSRDAVNRVQRLVRQAEGAASNKAAVKVGHAGTLDPIATGVLVVCIGPATKLIERVQRMPKEYLALFRIGCRSPSDDIETEIEHLPTAPIPERSAIEQVLPQFLGSIQQTPPAFSAAKVNGRRAYRMARRGEDVVLAPRTVRIDEIEVADYAYPELRLRIRCGGGTYIRSLGRDVASSLSTAAVMTALERTAIGSFRIDEALSLDMLNADAMKSALHSPLAALGGLSRVTLNAQDAVAIRHGRRIRTSTAIELQRSATLQDDQPANAAELVAVDEHGQLVALLLARPDGTLAPSRVFPQNG